MTRRSSEYLWLAAILAFALALRLIALDTALWYDEILSLVRFIRLPTAEVVTTYSSLNNHIFYSLQAQASVAIFGETPFALRLPAVLFGVAGVGALWWLARETAGRWQQAHFAALLLAVSYHHVWFSQNARGYTGLVFWCVLGVIFFLRGLRGGGAGAWIGFALALAAAMYTHLSAAFFFAAIGLVYLGRLAGLAARRGGQRLTLGSLAPLAGFALGGLIVLALYAPIVGQMIGTFGGVSDAGAAKVTVTQWTNPLWTILEVLRSLRNLGGVVVLGLPVALAFAAIGAISLWHREPILVAIFAVQVPLTLAILLALSFRIWPRYFLVDMTFVFLCLVQGVFAVSAFLADRLDTRRRFGLTGQTLGILGAAAALAGSLVLLPANYHHPKQDFLGARDLVEAERAPGDAVASLGLATLAYGSYYAPDWATIETPEDLRRLRAGAARIWVVYGFSTHTATHFPEALAMVQGELELVRRFPGTLGDGSVFVYRTRE